MISKKTFLLISIFLSFYYNTLGQDFFSDSITTNKNVRYKHSALIIPTVLIAYGLIGIESDGLKNWNAEFKEEINEHIDERLTIDDFSQYVPSLAVYALEAFGVKGKSGVRHHSSAILAPARRALFFVLI